MRVDQVITLVWVGNVALLGGTAYAGWKFWEQKKLQQQLGKAPPPAWPEVEAKPLETRWPGPVANFQHIWKTHVSGLVPPPPPKADDKPAPPPDLGATFRARFQLVSGFHSSDPAATSVSLLDNGQPRTLVLGQAVDGWRLVEFTIDDRSQATAVFYNARYEKNDGKVELKTSAPIVKDPATAGQTPFVAEYGGPVKPGPSPRDVVDVQAYQNRAGEWEIPYEEQRWWGDWGLPEIGEKTKFAERPEGLEVASDPPRGPLDNTRGITKGDVIVSVNDVPVKSLQDLVGYLRGPGREESRYVVVIERDGARRTQVYNVPRRRPAPDLHDPAQPRPK